MARPSTRLFLLAASYGFFSRILGDTLSTGLFQAPLVVIPLAVVACLAFNLYYSLRPVQSGFRGAAWLVTLYLGYILAGQVHNLFRPDLAYQLDGMALLVAATVGLVGFVVGFTLPLVFVSKRRIRL